MSNLTSILQSSAATIESLRALEPELNRAVEIVGRCLTGGHKLLACGNGGSAADASHFATEFVVRYQEDRRAYPALALTDSGSTLTAIGNDYTYDDAFSRQVEAFGQKGDVLVIFTTSGQSRNTLAALEAARKRGLESIAFLGRDGGPTKGIATVDLIVKSDVTARIQEAHKVLLHALCEAVEKVLPRT